MVVVAGSGKCLICSITNFALSVPVLYWLEMHGDCEYKSGKKQGQSFRIVMGHSIRGVGDNPAIHIFNAQGRAANFKK